MTAERVSGDILRKAQDLIERYRSGKAFPEEIPE
jgi:hypothetical protein